MSSEVLTTKLTINATIASCIAFTPGQLPIEIVEDIVAEAWKSASSANERQHLYSSLKQADPTLGDVIGRVAIRYVTLAMPLYSTEPSDHTLYSDIVREVEHTQPVDGPPDHAPSTADQHFRASHLRLDMTDVRGGTTTDCGIRVFEDRGGPLYSILNSVSSITLASLLPIPERDIRRLVGDSFILGTLREMEIVFGLLADLPRLTSLYLEYDVGVHSARLGKGPMPPIAFTALTFLRTRTCPCCGLPPHTYNAPYDGSRGHAAECARGAFARMFPRLRELWLDAPLFLRYLVVPPSLESITLDAPPPAKLFCSIQTYNVAAGLRRWMEPRQDAASGEAARMRLEKIVVRTGGVEPIGWRQAQEACDKYGVAFVREVHYV
ncbi:uncharacterized protein TRAVEDRAFT_67742 [Trametes versicolor FP-101664 SS1]|uniref:uncharacterized protein n=1 Tax=Trametes versicolor (strain FP-101664) TaxID=717944 RepID=UPI00046242D8|nr:uncharacterized protein TRAVEDRAFT_67742 [Trametes versicolor FP-101664 SS1]EIW63718.1 hypothetical protein TRAVEDRAFT_67742 [Trametes versicolor FP-101664 SS1]